MPIDMSQMKEENGVLVATDCGGCGSICPGESEESWNQRTWGGMARVEPGTCPWCQAAAAGIPVHERAEWIFEGDTYKWD